jgi:hypothetical protein
MNDFRDRVLGGKPLHEPLLRAKKVRGGTSVAAEEESFAELTIPRDETRRVNHRDSDRHRLDGAEAEVVHGGRTQRVTLVNLSGGGAMIEGADDLKLWDRLELRLADSSSVEAAVRWVRGNRFGLEFAHETRIETGEEELAETLRAVIRRSFPDIAVAAERNSQEPTDSAPIESEEEAGEFRGHEERDLRHPLIWSGHVHYNHDSIPVRLRNISHGGALVECGEALKVDAELLLDLGEAGTIFATVHWARGDAAGLKFHTPYDLRRLAESRPDVAGPRWVAPDYLRDVSSGNSPWASQWGRSDLGALHSALERRSIRKA